MIQFGVVKVWSAMLWYYELYDEYNSRHKSNFFFPCGCHGNYPRISESLQLSHCCLSVMCFELISMIIIVKSLIPKLKCLLSRIAVVFAQFIEAKCWVENEDVVGAAPTGDAPTTSDWSTI